jgi:predicted deacylase
MLVNYYTIEGRHTGPHLLITAGVHGDEWEPIIAVRELLGSIQPDDLHGKLTLVPVANESAFRAGERVGADGLDLARVCPGRADASLTERVAFELSKLMSSANYYIDLHTGGVRMKIWPLAGYLMHENERILTQQRAMARSFGLPLVWGTDASINGRTLSIARDLSIPAIYVEYLGSTTFCNDAVAAFVAGCRSVMNCLGMLSAVDRSGGGRYLAEERAAGSGHLQVCHPAPDDGLFLPVVELGDEVTVGVALGYFHCDQPHAESALPICADKSGHVVALRSYPRVQAGDGLGVVVKVAEF